MRHVGRPYVAAILVAALSLSCASGAPTGASPRLAPSSASSSAASTASSSATDAAATTPAARPAGLPLFDAHIHYSQPAWSLLTPEQALARLAEAGVRRAIVSSSPDEGTMRLYERAPDVVVPFLRPYRDEVGPATWARDGTTVAYVRSTYRRGVHRGIGEIHLSPGETALPVVKALIDLAVTERIWLQVHTDARGIDEVMRAVDGRTRVLWAHAGQFASPAEVRALVERHPTMWVELAGRTDIGTVESIDPGWRDLFLAHPARFLAGSDTWINPQWERLVEIHEGTRSWLAHLPADLARRIASENAERLFPR